MDKTQYTRVGVFLLACFVAFLSWFFLASYIGHRKSPQIREKTLTVHDDLLAIDGRHNANKVAVGKFGLVFLTPDGGKTWERRASGTHRTLSAVSFADHQNGFIVGSGGAVLKVSHVCRVGQTAACASPPNPACLSPSTAVPPSERRAGLKAVASSQ